ncbi:effector-associated constant component EACC1 [Streptomyces sp. 351MFTsu5.1]|uniref:effector-associated constant component EACC1 n=1 Tax=Streptomyces sp. 351MFTsu5.1 TaxID=1172180 RepID=UPI000362CA37|nr:hypothetical protein [Streptomyces sp. 351MFTsu5.1]
MRVVIAAPDHEDGHLLDELHDWLVGDGELHRTAEIRRVPLDTAGTMGALDVVEVVVGQGIAALNLAIAYASWRSTRPAAPGVTVTFPDGATVTVTDDGPEALERVLALLRESADNRPRVTAPPDQDGPARRPDEGTVAGRGREGVHGHGTA